MPLTSAPRTPLRSLRRTVLAGIVLLAAACGRDVDEHVRYAKLQDDRGDHVAAVASWSEAIEQAPQRAELYVGRGRSHLSSRQFADARKDLLAALEREPALVDARFLLVETWLEQGDHDRAFAATEGLETAGATRAERVRGRIRLSRGTTTLRTLIDQIAVSKPADENAIFRDIVALAFAGARRRMSDEQQLDEVRTLVGALDSAEQDLADAARHLTAAAGGQGNEAYEAVCDLAQLDLLASRPKSGTARLKDVLARNPVGPTRTRVMELQAECAERSGDLEGAIAALNVAIQENDRNADLRFARAMLLLKLGRTDDAAQDADVVAADPYRKTQTAMLSGVTKLLEGDPVGSVGDFQYVAATASGAPLSHLWLGLALSAAEADHASVMSAFTRSVEIDPRLYVGHLGRATTALAAGWDAEALAHAERCTDLEPERAAGWLVLGESHVRIGSAAERRRDREASFARAAVALGHALQLDPGGVTGQEALMMRNVVTGRLADGVSALRAALVYAGEPHLLVSLGELLMADRRIDEGLEFLREAVAAAPTDPRTVSALAHALHGQHRPEEALDVLRAAVSSSGDGGLWVLLAQFEITLSRDAAAAESLRTARSAHPQHAGLIALELDLALARDDLAAAESACDAGLALDSGTRAFHWSGGLKALRGDHESAQKALVASVDRFPADPVLWASLAIVAARQNDETLALVSARNAVDRAGADMPLIAAAVLAMLEVGAPESAWATARDAGALSDLGRRVLHAHVEHADSSDKARVALLDLHLRALTTGLGLHDGPSGQERRAAALATGTHRDLVLLDMLGNAHLARGDIGGATVHYERIVELEPDLFAAREKLALIRIGAGQDRAALEDLHALFRRGEAGPRAHALAGLLYDSQNNVEGARRHLEMAARMAPNDADILARLAHILERDGNHLRARKRWEQVLEIAPMHPMANARVADLVVGHDARRAETLARRAVASAPAAPFARRALARALAFADRTEEALAELDKVHVLDAADAKAWALRGTLLFSLDRREEARSAFTQAVAADESNAMAHLYVGLLAEQDGDVGAASRSYERVLELEPNHTIALNNLADVLLRTGGDLQRALRLAKSAVQRSGGRGEMLDTLGWIEFRLGEHETACATLQRAVSATPAASSARYHLAEALAAAGRLHECARELDVLDRTGDYPERAAAAALRRRHGL